MSGGLLLTYRSSAKQRALEAPLQILFTISELSLTQDSFKYQHSLAHSILSLEKDNFVDSRKSTREDRTSFRDSTAFKSLNLTERGHILCDIYNASCIIIFFSTSFVSALKGEFHFLHLFGSVFRF